MASMPRAMTPQPLRMRMWLVILSSLASTSNNCHATQRDLFQAI
eukprot:CAMPEP_0172364664 /NCGR_PEP_ID=MMETSP1060-20121228/7735_1 /TAXON_ID=37318 /ORGANISM="Pseudo-nitzschia pungens, Strain cf. cingulata" /LENGTH=43 /DNA_ID= /DNA_START= /DNA_END= /DNA_ORIENTATION=